MERNRESFVNALHRTRAGNTAEATAGFSSTLSSSSNSGRSNPKPKHPQALIKKRLKAGPATPQQCHNDFYLVSCWSLAQGPAVPKTSLAVLALL